MTSTRRTALVESYWVVPDQLLAGEYPAFVELDDAGARLDSLLDAGIDTFVDLTEAHELRPYATLLRQRAAPRGLQVQHERFPILDFGLPEREQMLRILDQLDAALAGGHRVYLHCHGGVGRTGMVVGCFLVRRGLTGPQALAQLAEWWKSMPKRRYHLRSPETDEQVQFVLDWRESPGRGPS